MGIGVFYIAQLYTNKQYTCIVMKKLNFICFFISFIVFLFYYSEISFAQLTPPGQEYVLSFGSEKVAIAPVNASLNLGSEFTMEAWIFPQGNQDAVIMGKHLDAGHIESVSYIIQTVDGGKVEFIQTIGDAGSRTSVISSNILVTNSWTHVAAILGSGTMKLYINGIEEGNIANPGTPLNESIPFAIGNSYDENHETGAGFFGHFAQVRIWNKALTTTEIVDNASVYLNGDEADLIAYWPLDDGDGQIARDLAANGLDLMLGTTTEEDEHDPKWVYSVFVNDTYFTIASYDSIPMGGGQLIDFDSDGDLDYIGINEIKQWLQMLKAARNDGLGNFTDATTEVLGADTVKLTHPGSLVLIADFNGDGRDDAFIGDMGIDAPPFGGAQNRIFIQNSNGMLIDETVSRLPSFNGFTHANALGDIDGDGDFDIFAKDSPGIIDGTGHAGFYVNDGDGYFTFDMTRTPPELVEHDLFWAHTIADIDNDGDNDLFAGSSKSGPVGFEYFEYRDVLILNNGQGYFDYAPIETFPINDPPDYFSISQPEIVAADVNNDGWVDFLQEMSPKERIEPAPGKIKLLLNNANGTFRDANTKLPFFESLCYPVVADLNNDGNPDIISNIVPMIGMALFMNRANVDFINAIPIIPPAPYNTYAGIHLGDLDSDGDVDILSTDGNGLVFIRNEKPFNVLEHFPLQVPPVPELISPDNESSVSTNPVLIWTDSLETSCNVQVSTDPEFSTLVIDITGVVLDTLLLHNLTANQLYYWRVNASNITGTSDWSEVRMFETDITGIINIEFGDIAKIYPNPSKGTFYFEVNKQGNNDLFVQIVDVSGKIIFTKNKITKTIEEIDLGNYAKGIYFIQVRSDKYFKTEKLIIE